jgi:hypothetical protein
MARCSLMRVVYAEMKVGSTSVALVRSRSAALFSLRCMYAIARLLYGSADSGSASIACKQARR